MQQLATKEDIQRLEEIMTVSNKISKLKALDLVKFTEFIEAFGYDYKTARKRYDHATIKKQGTPLMIRLSKI